jgi:hypothetical protein
VVFREVLARRCFGLQYGLFFANVLAGSAIGQLEIFLDPKEIPSRLAVVVPAQVAHAL